MADKNQYRYLTKTGLKSLVNGLMRDRVVYGAVKKDGFPAYGRITRFEDLELTQTPAHLSAKEFFFPQREVLLKFDMQIGSHEPVVAHQGQAVIGLHSCDIHALNLMDKVFSYGTGDANYLSRRADTIIVGAECFPDEYCFCSSVETMNVNTGFDIFLHEIKSGFLVRTGTDVGRHLLNKLTKTVKASASQIKELDRLKNKKDGAFKTRLNAPAKDLPGIYAQSNDSPVWDRIGGVCYGCGSCNNVCPTCYCFDVKDEVGANLKDGVRVRVWDGCTLEDFAKVAGGHNFRKTRASRLRHRFNRKFRYLTDRFDALFCVGCGRCSRACLVKINIAQVTNELIAESKSPGDSGVTGDR